MMPVFVAGELAGYAAIKAHWLDIGGKDPYSTDTIDVFQEGTIFPGVKLFSRGRLVSDIFRMATANSRVPKMVAGDINALVVGVRTGRRGADARRRAARPGAVPRLRGPDVRPRRGGRARVVRQAARRPLRRARGDGLQRHRRRPGPVRDRARRLRLDGPDRLLRLAAAAGRPDQLPAPVHGVGQPHRRDDARRRRRGAERGPLPPDRGRHAAGHAVPRRVALAVLPLRLGRRPGHRGDLPGRPPGDAGLRARGERRRHLRARVVGRAGGHRRAVDGRLAAPDRPGRPRGRRRRVEPDARVRGRDALHLHGGVGGEEPVAARAGRARAGLLRARAPARRPRRRPQLPHARGRVAHERARAHEERSRGASRAAARAGPTRSR